MPLWAQTVSGTTGEGAQYSIFVPTTWNGDVVYYAHGIKDIAEPVALPINNGFPGFRDALGGMGYAVAYSSFSENGWAVQDGIQKTHQLRGLFTSVAGKPRRSYLAGHSMGGLITVALAEQFPSQYDGALPMCGVVGGAQKQIDYIANVRTLFDVFYKDVLPGNALDMPASLNVATQVIAPAQAAIIANPTGVVTMARIAQTPLPFAPLPGGFPELIQSVITALAFDARGAEDLLSRTHGHSPFFNNSPTYYTGALPAPLLESINLAAEKFDETPDAANYLRNYYQPTGNATIPTLTIHNTRDPLVPFFHDSVYATLTRDAGARDMLTRTSVDRYGHCNFTVAEMTKAFTDLVKWVETGARPTP
jgi:pimeloyl-ACP methyl ester carboxylesterase